MRKEEKQTIGEGLEKATEKKDVQPGEGDPIADSFFLEESLMNITIVDLNNRELNLKMVQQELVLELREFLNEHVQTCFFTHYYFQHQGKKINDYTELRELDLKADPKIYMKPERYDEKSSRLHIKRLKEILNQPPVLTSQTDSGMLAAAQQLPSQQDKEANQDPEEGKKGVEGSVSKPAEEKQSTDGKEQPNEEQKDVQKEEDKEITDKATDQEEKMKKNYESFLKIIEQDSNKEIPLPVKNIENPLAHLFRHSISQELNKINHVKCLELLQFSSFNPVPEHRKLLGDLFYLTVKTLEGQECGITACVNGFYRNNNQEKTNFNPTPNNKGNPCYSYTLIGCLHQLSQQFGANLETYINSILQTEPYFLTQSSTPLNHWLISREAFNKATQQKGQDSDNQSIPLHGLDPKGIRDWNEEFQVVKAFPKETIMQRTQRDRAVMKVYNDFLEAAVKGATAIVNGNLTALNPNEPEKQQVFVYNYIFFSFAVDLPDSFKDLTSIDNNPSFTQANHDIMGLRTLQILDVEDLHILATCLVQYKGNRVIAQSIIPGILNNNDLTSLAEYGSVDEQKTIYASETFHNLMKKVCGHLGIKENKVLDGSGKEVEIAGSVEVKGIKGTDKRNYLVDLQGLTPRDANYEGEENHTCLLRPELLMMYQRSKNIDYANAKIKDQLARWEEEAKVTDEEGKGIDEAQRKALEDKKRKELNLKKLLEYDRLLKEAPKYAFNTNVFKKNVKLALSDEEVKKEEESVREVSAFLKDQALEKLIQNLSNVEGTPTDSESLEQAFHQHGINMRYLGEAATRMKDKDLSHIKMILEREMVFRAFKHILGEEMRLSPDTYLSSVVSHLLNCLLAPTPCLTQLNEDQIAFVDETIQSQIVEVVEEEKKEEKKEVEGEVQESNGGLSKKEKKKLKKKMKKEEGKGENEESPPRNPEISQNKGKKEYLFQLEQPPFKVSDLFASSTVANSLMKIELPNSLQMKPAQLYEKIRYIVQTRYRFTLPEKQEELVCLKSGSNKLSLLRDICLKLGIKLVASDDREYILDNENGLEKLQQQQARLLSLKNPSPASKKKANKNQAVDSPLSYSSLPFRCGDIVEIYPVIKHLDIQNSDVRTLLNSAKQSFKENMFEKAFELYSQSINTMLSIQGPMNKDVAACISKLASIQFKFGDFLQAIELQTKSLILQERLLGPDHPQAAYSYSNLAFYHHSCGYFCKGFDYMYRALNILRVSCGENHPDISSIYLNLGLMYQDYENFQAAIDCFLESLYRNIELFGEKHLQVATCYQALAHSSFQLGDYRGALDHQEKAHKILTQILPPDDQYIKASQSQMNQFMQLSVYMEKVKSGEKPRAIGSNKPQQLKGPKQEQQAQQQQANRFNQLYQRIANPKNKNPLDYLEFNYMKQQMLEKVLKEQQQMAGQQKQENSGEQQVESENQA